MKQDMIIVEEYILAPLPCAPQARPFPWAKKQKQEEKTPMNYASVNVEASAVDVTAKQRKYLQNRVYDVYSDKRADLEVEFNLNPINPKTAEELQQLIKDGHFEIRGLGEKKPNRYFHWSEALTFRKAPADEAGFQMAKDELKIARQEAEDIINVLPLEDGFKALKAFEGWTVSSK